MSVYKDYPEGCGPSAGPFDVITEEGEQTTRDEIHVQVSYDFEPPLVEMYSIEGDDNGKAVVFMSPTRARELAAALIECADFIDRAAMTTEDKAKDAGDGR